MRKDVYSGWIELRDPKAVPERLRRPVFQKSMESANFAKETDMENVGADAIELLSDFNDLLSVAMVEKWSFSEVVSIEEMLNLPSRAYDDIRQAVAPFVNDLIPDFGVDPDPKAITEPLAE